MYLSRIQLTAAIANYSQLGLILKDRSYGMHRLLWDLFPDGERFLYREEMAREQLEVPNNRPLFYVLSRQKPVQENPLFDVESKPFQPSLKSGDRLSFQLRANPTIARRQEGKKQSSRHDVVMDAQLQWLTSACRDRQLPLSGKKESLRKSLLQHPDYAFQQGAAELKKQLDMTMDEAAQQWLVKRGAANGFHIETIQATGYRWHALPEKGRRAGYSSMDYEGVLTVTEPEAFSELLNKGIGPSKAFGCGLLMVRRMSR